jgi:hypothetical protein
LHTERTAAIAIQLVAVIALFGALEETVAALLTRSTRDWTIEARLHDLAVVTATIVR